MRSRILKHHITISLPSFSLCYSSDTIISYRRPGRIFDFDGQVREAFQKGTRFLFGDAALARGQFDDIDRLHRSDNAGTSA
jgi:hypothetical protein